MIRAVLLGLLLSAATLPASPAARHFDLEGSTPAADATVHHVEEVRLWFTAAPQAGATSIRVIDAAGEPVPTGDVVAVGDGGRTFGVRLPDMLAPGAYTVAWRSMAADGHVVRGDFAFSVAPH